MGRVQRGRHRSPSQPSKQYTGEELLFLGCSLLPGRTAHTIPVCIAWTTSRLGVHGPPLVPLGPVRPGLLRPLFAPASCSHAGLKKVSHVDGPGDPGTVISTLPHIPLALVPVFLELLLCKRLVLCPNPASATVCQERH